MLFHVRKMFVYRDLPLLQTSKMCGHETEGSLSAQVESIVHVQPSQQVGPRYDEDLTRIYARDNESKKICRR